MNRLKGKTMAKEAYDVIYSLGTNCACAEYLRKYNLRIYAGPFDWLISSDIYAPFKAITTHFKSFLDFAYIIPSKQASHKSCNQVCQHAQTNYVFFHDFLPDQPLTQQMPTIQAKYARRSARFENDLKSGKKVLLVWYAETGSKPPVAEFLSYIRQIRQQYLNPNIHFLFISYTGEETSSCQQLLEGVTAYQLPQNCLAQRQENYLLWDQKQIQPILARLSLKISYGKHLRKQLKALFFRILSVGILNRQKRHTFVENHAKNDGE